MKPKTHTAVIQPFCVLGTGVIKALSIFSGAVLRRRETSKGIFEEGIDSTGRQAVVALDDNGDFAAGSSDLTAFVAELKSPTE